MLTEIEKAADRGRKDYRWFKTHCLDVNPEHYWSKMKEVDDSVRDNEKTAVGAGHGVSKTYNAARTALNFLYCYYPSTVVTLAPSRDQVRNLMWREIGTAHSNARIALGGKLTTMMLDMQPELGIRWYALGLATKPDTVTQEATRLQGIHNMHVLIILDEAAGILPEIWRAIQFIGAPFKRVLAIGNPTSKFGDFPQALKDPNWNNIQISVKDTPNFKQGKQVIPGVYGREFEREVRLKYGIDSDQYSVRVEGGISQRGAEGSYYSGPLNDIRKLGQIGIVPHNPHHLVYPVLDFGYTTGIWFVQPAGVNYHIIRYYEDSGCAIKTYTQLLNEYEKDMGYKYGMLQVPCDMDSNATRIITGETALDTLRDLGYQAEPLPKEHRVDEGIQRTQKFLNVCFFDETNCDYGLECIEQYHEKINKKMSTEDKPVFIGVPEKDGSDHAADGLRYISLAAKMGRFKTSGISKEDWKQKKAEHGY